MEMLSLIILLSVILLAWFTKISPGILGIAGAFIIGFFVTVDGILVSSVGGGCAEILAAFPYKLISRILFTSLFFVTISQNGTLELLTEKLIRLTKGRANLYPIIVYFVSAVLHSLGVDSFTVLLVLIPIVCAVAQRCGQEIYIYIVAVWCTAYGFALTPVCFDYILAVGLAETNGYALPNVIYYFRFAILATILFFLYYFLFGAYKFKSDSDAFGEENSVMSGKQKLSTVFMLAFVAITLMGYEVSVVAATLACILMLVTKADQKNVIANMPWSTMILLIGMSMCIQMVNLAGGIDLLVGFFETFMSKKSILAIITLISALMGLVSSATGVVQPTMAAAAPGLAAAYGTEPGTLLMCAMLGSVATSISPFSTLGGIMIGASPEEANKNNALFNRLLICAVINTVAAVVYAHLGALNPF